jgi:hypothetical protein
MTASSSSPQWVTPVASVLTGNAGAGCPSCNAFLVAPVALQWHSCQLWLESHNKISKGRRIKPAEESS